MNNPNLEGNSDGPMYIASVENTAAHAISPEKQQLTSTLPTNIAIKSETARKHLLCCGSPPRAKRKSRDCLSNVRKVKDTLLDNGCSSKVDVQTLENNSQQETFALSVSNIPFQWTSEQVANYIQEHCTEVYAIEHLEGGDPESGQSIRIVFISFEHCNSARKQLKMKTANGRKLNVAFSVPEDSDSDSGSESTVLLQNRPNEPPKTPSPNRTTNSALDLDVWANDPGGVYGLRADFLESLGVTPPIDKWVHVSNFRCDKSELREVLELAGHLVLCNVVSVCNKYARAMYSHPIEAIQAVSMLNGQMFYGQVLKVSMYRCPNNEVILPKGLSNIGPGLGIDGQPLRDVVKEYERYLSGKTSSVNRTIFHETRQSIDNPIENAESPSPKRKRVADTTQNLHQTCSAPSNSSNSWYQNWYPRHASYQNQNAFGPRTRFPTAYDPSQNLNSMGDTGWRPPLRFRCPGQVSNNWSASASNTSVGTTGIDTSGNSFVHTQGYKDISSAVELSNLPLTVTFSTLAEKMSQCGHLNSLELTRPGCAVVRFASTIFAQKCYQQYNNMILMGNQIEVKYV